MELYWRCSVTNVMGIWHDFDPMNIISELKYQVKAYIGRWTLVPFVAHRLLSDMEFVTDARTLSV